MENSNEIERSEMWYSIYEVLARLDLKQVEGDTLDRSSAATEIEQAVKKLLPIHNVSNQRKILIEYEKNHYTPIEWIQASEQCIKEIDEYLSINTNL